MKRKEHLDDMDMEVKFKFDNLFINGTYRIEVIFEVIIQSLFRIVRNKAVSGKPIISIIMMKL